MFRDLGEGEYIGYHHDCITLFYSPRCQGMVPAVLASLLAAEAIGSNLEREAPFGDFLADFAKIVLNDSLESGFSGYSSERCYEKYMGSNSCPKERSLSGLCLKDGKRSRKVLVLIWWGKFSFLFVNFFWLPLSQTCNVNNGNDESKEKLQKVIKKTWTLFYDMCHLRKNSFRDS